MTRRLLALIVLTAALVVPTAALADDGGNGSAPVTARAGHAVAFLDRVSLRLDKRFRAFSSHCLVQNAPERCTKAANRFSNRLDRLRAKLVKVERTIKARCAAANPPAKCSMSGDVIVRIDTLLATIAGDTAKIKAAFQGAGSSS